MFEFPAPPMPEDTPSGERSLRLRWEDVAQDGRLMVTALAHANDATVWGGLLEEHAGLAQADRDGILPILTRMTAVGTAETMRVIDPVRARGTYRFAQGDDRVYLQTWVEARGARGTMVPRTAPGPEVSLGRMFIENTFTRPFAPPGERKVSRIDFAEVRARYDQPAPATAMEVPAGATPLDDAYIPDEAVTRFGLEHTDSNQHVNSLVYPRLFAEAALRRLDARDVLVRALDIAFRKPSFAGDTVRVHLRRFRVGDRVGAAGYLVGEGEDRPRVCARIVLG